MANVHDIKPSRSQVAQKPRYRDYKPDLRNDFNKSCGYCDDDDLYAMSGRAFHIDHFAPKSKFNNLETSYSNLVYSCSICNIYKSNYWVSNSSNTPVVGNEGLADPCGPDFDDHLARDANGQIISITPLGKFIHRKLKLGLRRHQLIWLITKSKRTLSALRDEIAEAQQGSTERNELLEMLNSVLSEFLQYTEELGNA